MSGEKVNFTESKEQQDGGAKKILDRSTIDFPYLPLETAIEVATALHNRTEFETCDQDELSAELGQTISGAFRQKTSTARSFGLIDKDGRSAFKLSGLGKRIVEEATKKAAMMDAFLEVDLYNAIYEKFKGHNLPPDKALERTMAELGVASKQTARARQAFQKSAHQAGFFESGDTRLVKPNVRSSVDNEQQLRTESNLPDVPPAPAPPNPPYGGGGGGGGGGSFPPDTDPIIAGLISRLPASGEVWPVSERELWLDILKSSFQLVYKE